MKRRRAALLLLGTLVLGVFTALVTTAAIAFVRTPVNTWSSPMFVVETHAATPGATYDNGYMLVLFNDARVGESTLKLMSMPLVADMRDVVSTRPEVSPEIDAFLGLKWLPRPLASERMLNQSFCVRMYGWPFRCAWYGEVGNAGRPTEPPWTPSGYGSIDIGSGSANQRLLPSRVLWRGLIANSAIFAVAWALLFLGPGSLRRRLRRRRNRCAHCGYDLRAAPIGAPCPECGRAADDATKTRSS